MAKVIANVDDQVKADAAALYDALGMSLSTAINVFLRQSVENHGMPFTPQLERPQRRVNWGYEGLERPRVADGAVMSDTAYDPEESVYDNL